MRSYGWGNAKPGGNKGTIALIVTLVAFFVLAWGGLYDRLEILQFVASDFANRPWSLITYPLFVMGGDGSGAFFLIILFYWMYSICGAVEERLGAVKLWIAFFALSFIFAVSVFLGYFLIAFGQAAFDTSLSGPYLGVAALTVAWAAIYPDSIIRLFFLIPVQAKWVAVIIAALVLFGYGNRAPIIGIFAVAPLGLAWMWGRRGLPWPMEGKARETVAKKKEEHFRVFIDDVKTREKEREERERLKKLFESSLDDPEDKK